MNNPPDPGQGPPNPNGGISPSGSLFGRKKRYQPKASGMELNTGLPTANTFSGTPSNLGSPGLNFQAPQVMNYNFQNFTNHNPNHEIAQNRVLPSSSNQNFSNQNQPTNNFQNQPNNQFGNLNNRSNFNANTETGFGSGFNQQNNAFGNINAGAGFGSPGFNQPTNPFANANQNNGLFPSVSDLSTTNTKQSQDMPNRSISLLSPTPSSFIDKRKQEFSNDQSEDKNKKATNSSNSAFDVSNKNASTLPFDINSTQPKTLDFNASTKPTHFGSNNVSNVTFGAHAADPQTASKGSATNNLSKSIFNTTGTSTFGFNAPPQQTKVTFGAPAGITFGDLNIPNKEKESGTDKPAPASFGFGTSKTKPISFGNIGDASAKSANTNFGLFGQKSNEKVEPSNQPNDVNPTLSTQAGTRLFGADAQKSIFNAEPSSQTSNSISPVPTQVKPNVFSTFKQNSGTFFDSLNKTNNLNPFAPAQNKVVSFGTSIQSKAPVTSSTTQPSKPISNSLTKPINLDTNTSTQSETPRFWEPSDPNAFINSNLAQPTSSKTGTSTTTNALSFGALPQTNDVNLPISSQSNQNKRKDQSIMKEVDPTFPSNNKVEEAPINNSVKKTKSDNPESLTAREKWHVNQMALAIAFKEKLEEYMKEQNSTKVIEESLKNYYIKSQMMENLFKKAIEEEEENKPPSQIPKGSFKNKEQGRSNNIESQSSSRVYTNLGSISNQTNVPISTTTSNFNVGAFKSNQNESSKTSVFGTPSVATSNNLGFGQSSAKEAPKSSISNTFGTGLGQNAPLNPVQVNSFKSVFNQAPAPKSNPFASTSDSTSSAPKFSFGVTPAQGVPSISVSNSSVKPVGEASDNITSIFGAQPKQGNPSNSSTYVNSGSKSFQSSMWNTNKEQKPEPSHNTSSAFGGQPAQSSFSTAARPSIFGAKPTQPQKTNPFGQLTAIPTDPISSVFGVQPAQETQSTSNHSITFGAKPIKSTLVNPFGTKPTQSTAANPFGQSTSIPTDPFSPIFGAQPNQGTSSTPGKSIVFGANPFGTQPGASSNVPTAQPVGSDDEGEDEEGFRGDRTNDELVKRGVGEEEEKTLYEARSKLQAYNNEKKSYESFGVGFLKVNHNVETNKYRILFRLEGSGKLMINSYILDNCLQKAEEKRIVFKASTLEGRPTPFLASFKLPKECSDMADAIRTGQNGDSNSQDNLKDNEKQLTSLNSEHPNESISNLKASELIHVLFPAKLNHSEGKQNDDVKEKEEVIAAEESAPGPSSIVEDNFMDLLTVGQRINFKSVYQQDSDNLIPPFSNKTARELMTELFPEKKLPKVEHKDEEAPILDSALQTLNKVEDGNLTMVNDPIENKEKQLNPIFEDQFKVDGIEEKNCDHDIRTSEENIEFDQLNQLSTKDTDFAEIDDIIAATEMDMSLPSIVQDKPDESKAKVIERYYNDQSKDINKTVYSSLKVEPYGYESGSQGLSSPTLAGDDLNFNTVDYKQFSLDNINDNDSEFINNMDHSKVEHENGNVSFIEHSYSELMITGEGESYDEPQIEVRARSYGILPSDKSYFNLGVGPFKINYNTKKGFYRILCRQEGSGKLLINSRMIQDTPIKAIQHKKYFAIKFKANNLDGFPSLYTIFVKTKEEADQLEIVFNKSIVQSSGDVLEYD